MLHNIHSQFSGYSYSRPSPALFAVPSACKTASFPLPLPIAAHHLWHVQPPFMSPSAAAVLHSNLPQLQHPTPSFQRPSSIDWRQHGFVEPHTSHLTPHTSHLTPHTPHSTPHTPYLTPHTSHTVQRCVASAQPRSMRVLLGEICRGGNGNKRSC